MRSSFATRLQRLEEKAAHQSSIREKEEWDALARCLGPWETKRLLIALKASKQYAWHPEAVNLLKLAEKRLLGGWTYADRLALDKQDRDKRQILWDLMRELGPRFNGSYLDTYRLDAYDVTEAELKQLVEVAAKATTASDLEPIAAVVRRLRLDGHIMEIAEFEALILRGEIAPPPPPHWLDFERPPEMHQRL